MSELQVELNAEVDSAGSNKLIDAVVDVFSPATEFLGMLGDAVRLARVEVAANITRRAKEIADEHDFDLQAPPLKFLVPFYEKSSVEEGEDDEAIDRWAQLLLSRAKDDTLPSRYISILSQLSSSQANLLRQLFLGEEQSCVPTYAFEQFNAIVLEFRSELVYGLGDQIIATSETPMDDMSDELPNVFSGPGVITQGYRVGTSHKSLLSTDINLANITEWRSLDFSLLESLGLVRKHDFEFRWNDSSDALEQFFAIEMVVISELGVDFLSSVDGETRTYLSERRSLHQKNNGRFSMFMRTIKQDK